MKTQNPAPLQPKWICAAAIGALTMGVIVGANAQDNTNDLPAPPKAEQMADGWDGGPEDENGPPPRPQGAAGRGPRGGQGGGRDEMRPPRGMDGEGPEGFGPPQGGPGRGGPGQGGPGRGGPGRGGPGMGPGQGGRGPGGPGQGGPGMGRPGPGGPGQGGPGRGGPGGPRGEAMNTAEGAAMSLEQAYRTAGRIGTEKLKGDALNLQGQARDYYNRAMEAYKAKNYDKSSSLARASSHLSQAAMALSESERVAGPAGWAAPPVPTGAKAPVALDQNRAAMTLGHTYRVLGEGIEGKDATATRWVGTAKSFYKTASASYNTKDYDAAESYAIAADEIVRAARDASDASDASEL